MFYQSSSLCPVFTVTGAGQNPLVFWLLSGAFCVENSVQACSAWTSSRCSLSLKAADRLSRSWEVVDHNSMSVVQGILVLHVGITKAVWAFWKLKLLFFSVSGRQAAVGGFPAQVSEIGCICGHAPISVSRVIIYWKDLHLLQGGMQSGYPILHLSMLCKTKKIWPANAVKAIIHKKCFPP